jgi:hypothetical protein
MILPTIPPAPGAIEALQHVPAEQRLRLAEEIAYRPVIYPDDTEA